MSDQTVEEARATMRTAWERLDAADDPAEHRAALAASDAAENAYDTALSAQGAGEPMAIHAVDLFHDTDDWFASGADEAHQRHLDELGHVHDDADEDVAS